MRWQTTFSSRTLCPRRNVGRQQPSCRRLFRGIIGLRLMPWYMDSLFTWPPAVRCWVSLRQQPIGSLILESVRVSIICTSIKPYTSYARCCGSDGCTGDCYSTVADMEKPITGWKLIVTLFLLSLRLRGSVGDKLMNRWYKYVKKP